MINIYSELVLFTNGQRKEANYCKRFNPGREDYAVRRHIQLHR